MGRFPNSRPPRPNPSARSEGATPGSEDIGPAFDAEDPEAGPEGANREDERPWDHGRGQHARRRAHSDSDPGPRKGPSGKRQEGSRGAGARNSGARGFGRRPQPPRAAFEEGDDVWIWGLHAGKAALANPARTVRSALVTRNAAIRIDMDPERLPEAWTLLEPRDIDNRLPEGAVHQGLAVLAAPLEPTPLDEVVFSPERPVVILDQVTDPQNVGAILRSASAFGFGGVILQTRNAPAFGGALAKAAAGAVEALAEVRVVNISRAIGELRSAGWRVVGLDGAADADLASGFAGKGPLAVVLGAEGAGLRPGVASACSGLARIPMADGAESLNVSNAAAIAFYEAARLTGAGRASL